MSKTVSDSYKVALWRLHIHTWFNSALTQAEYCNEHGLSSGLFSEWKNKLYPKPKYWVNPVNIRDHGGQKTQLGEHEVENLVLFFLVNMPRKKAANLLGVGEKVISEYYQRIGLNMVDGALKYPKLFFNSGVLLLLGPPPNAKKLLLQYAERQKMTNVSDERLMAICMQRTLLHYSNYSWCDDEIYPFYVKGLWGYFTNVYVDQCGLMPTDWGFEVVQQMCNDVPLEEMVMAVWRNTFKGGNGKLLLHKATWQALYKDRSRHGMGETWLNSVGQDLRWVMQEGHLNKSSTYRPFDEPMEKIFPEIT